MAAKYSQLKIFHYKDKIDSLPKEKEEIKAPLHIRIKPTNLCNHNCWYCAYKVDNLQLGQDMVERDYIPEEKMMEIIDDCAEMGVKAITFSGGGEPFNYRYYLNTIKKLITTDISFASLTNGAKVKGEIAELFAKHGTWLRISIDGWDSESYANYRETKLTEFDKVIQNMRDFKSYEGKCALGVSYIIDDKNYKHIHEFTKLIKSTGADSIKLSACIVDNEASKNNEYHKPIYDEVKNQINKIREDFEDDSFEIFDAYHLMEERFDKDYNWCPYMQVLPIIGADLNIYPCQDKAYNLDTGLVGSIKNRRFKDFWFDDKNKFFNINPEKVCNHHCVANMKNKMILDYLDVDNEHLGFV